ncbi:MAG: hypothetical protein KDE27_19220 [Planctomycetes bacterium]|nr:hypothetical protein [Planctomycetota bacterium]
MVDFVHVGLPKAASTWLQDVFFHDHPELAVLGSRKGDGELHVPFTREIRRLVVGGDLSADVGAFAATVRELAQRLRERRSAAGHTIRVTGISSEVLSGRWPTGENSRFLAGALRQAFPAAKIVLILREQRSALESTYKEFVRLGGTGSFRRFLLDPVNVHGFVHDDRPRHSHTIEFFKYSRLIALYRELFGRDRVHVDAMERLRDDPDAFAARLSTFLGVGAHTPARTRANPQLSPAALLLLRALNHGCSTPYHHRYGPMPLTALLLPFARRRMHDGEALRANRWLLRRRVSSRLQHRLADAVLPVADRWLLRHLPGAGRFRFDRLPTELQRFLVGEYAADNRALAAMVDLDLGGLGYAG